MIVGVNEKTKSGLLIEHRFFAKSIYNRFFVNQPNLMVPVYSNSTKDWLNASRHMFYPYCWILVHNKGFCLLRGSPLRVAHFVRPLRERDTSCDPFSGWTFRERDTLWNAFFESYVEIFLISQDNLGKI